MFIKTIKPTFLSNDVLSKTLKLFLNLVLLIIKVWPKRRTPSTQKNKFLISLSRTKTIFLSKYDAF